MERKIIKNLITDKERALYGLENAVIDHCKFCGVADGESCLKETSNLKVINSEFMLRYPLWHAYELDVENSVFYETSRAPLWYGRNVKICNSQIESVKAVRECDNVSIFSSKINSTEFGWLTRTIELNSCSLISEYAFLHASDIKIERLNFNGKYSFQYVENGYIKQSILNTKDAFWHSKNVTVYDSEVKGEYLGWYSENLTFINCKISGTQPLCYAKNLKLINCTMENCDLCFENSEVEAEIIGNVESVKNPIGKISATSIGNVIIDEFTRGKCEIITK